MGRRGAAKKARARPARQAQPATAPAPQLVVEEQQPKPQMRDPYGGDQMVELINKNYY